MVPTTFPVTVYSCAGCGTYGLRKFNIARHVRQCRDCSGARIIETEGEVHCPGVEVAHPAVPDSLSEDEASDLVNVLTADKQQLLTILAQDVDEQDVLPRLFRYTKGARGIGRFSNMFQHGNDIFQTTHDTLRRSTKGEVIQELLPFLVGVMERIVIAMKDKPLPKKARNHLIVFEYEFLTVEVESGLTLQQILTASHAPSKAVAKMIMELKKRLRYELDQLPHMSASRLEALRHKAVCSEAMGVAHKLRGMPA